jgi:hypothetical protein
VEVVGDDQQRLLLGDLGEQPEHAERHVESFVHGLVAERERGAKRCRLRCGQAVDLVERGPQDLVQRCVGELRLELDARPAQHAHPVAALGCVSEEGRLSDSCLAGDDDGSAPPCTRVVDETFDDAGLGVAADQHLTSALDPARRRRRARL